MQVAQKIGEAVIAPWQANLTDGQHAVIYYFFGISLFAMLAMLIRSVIIQKQATPAFSNVMILNICVTAVATISYALILFQYQQSYVLLNGMWHPTASAVNMKVLRYIDWTITVPLLVAEVLLVSTLSPRLRAALSRIGITASLCMIFVGFLGGVIIGGGRDFDALLAFGLISGVFFIVIYAVLLFTVFRSLRTLSSRAGTWYIRALLLLMSTWFIYPVAYGIQGFASGGVWAMVVAICLCVADVLAKVGFGLLLQRTIMQRQADEETAEA